MRSLPNLLAVLACAAALSGCAAPAERGVAPDLEPPPARADAPLTKVEALDIVTHARDTDHAVKSLDEHRLAFALDETTFDWFRENGAAPEVIDYLKKRARVDWDGLRGDVDPTAPEGSGYVDPRRGFDDFAGRDRRDFSPRSVDPFEVPPRDSPFERRLEDRDRSTIFLPR
ncbi:hypothetical protein HY251_19175 [bacterium]|nr:hypothetical protein [bacterium]